MAGSTERGRLRAKSNAACVVAVRHVGRVHLAKRLEAEDLGVHPREQVSARFRPDGERDREARHAGLQPGAHLLVPVNRPERLVGRVPAPFGVHREDGIEGRLTIVRHAVEARAVLAGHPEHGVGQVLVAEEEDDQLRAHLARDDPVLQREVPERRAGGGVVDRRHVAVAEQRREVGGVDARPGHRVADEDELRPQRAQVRDDVGIERHRPRAPGLERGEVAGRHSGGGGEAAERAQAERDRERGDEDGDERDRLGSCRHDTLPPAPGNGAPSFAAIARP